MTVVPDAGARFARGLQVLQDLGHERSEVLERLERIAPDLAWHLVAFGYGDIQGRPGLDLKSRSLVSLCTLAALGATETQVALDAKSALAAGWRTEELVEALMQVALHAGFPRALDALEALRREKESKDEG